MPILAEPTRFSKLINGKFESPMSLAFQRHHFQWNQAYCYRDNPTPDSIEIGVFGKLTWGLKLAINFDVGAMKNMTLNFTFDPSLEY